MLVINKRGVNKNIRNSLLSSPLFVSQCHLEEVWLSHLFSQVGGGFALLKDALVARQQNRLVDFSVILIKTRRYH